MPTFDSQRVAADNRALVRKIQKAMAFVAPTTVAVPASVFHTDGTLIDFKTLLWQPVGLVTPDGYTFGREVSKEDINALGYASAVRSDPTTVARTVSFTPLERGKRIIKEISLGQDLSTVKQGLANGEVVIDHVDMPIGAEYRLMIVGLDGSTLDQWINAKCYPSVKLASTGEETWGQEGAVTEQLTFDVYADAALGTPVREYFGGTGAKNQKTALGYTQNTV